MIKIFLGNIWLYYSFFHRVKCWCYLFKCIYTFFPKTQTHDKFGAHRSEENIGVIFDYKLKIYVWSIVHDILANRTKVKPKINRQMHHTKAMTNHYLYLWKPHPTRGTSRKSQFYNSLHHKFPDFRRFVSIAESRVSHFTGSWLI